MGALFIEYGHASVNKHDEILCGDSYALARDKNGVTIVLSDGLGSGVKANILSTLTATILSTMMAHDLPMQECVETVAKTLPVCSVRHLAYSTFTVAQLRDDRVRLVQYDNPRAILLREGKCADYDSMLYQMGDK